VADDEQRRRDLPVSATALVLTIVAAVALCLIVLAAGRVVWQFLSTVFRVI